MDYTGQAVRNLLESRWLMEGFGRQCVFSIQDLGSLKSKRLQYELESKVLEQGNIGDYLGDYRGQ